MAEFWLFATGLLVGGLFGYIVGMYSILHSFRRMFYDTMDRKDQESYDHDHNDADWWKRGEKP